MPDHAFFDALWDDCCGDTPVLHLCGELDIFSGVDLREAIGTPGMCSSVVVDLAGLVFIDASGLSVLLELKRALEDSGGSVVFRGARGLVRRVFQMARSDLLLDGS